MQGNTKPDIAQTQSQDSEESLDLGRILWLVKKRRLWVLASAFCTVAATVSTLSVVPNRYKSEATILVIEQQISQTLVAPLSTTSLAERLQSITQEVLSRARLLEIIDELSLFEKSKGGSPDELIQSMRKSIEIEPIEPNARREFTAFKISFTARTPELAQQVTRTLASSFIEKNLKTQENRATTTTNFLQEQLEEKHKTAAALEQRMQAFKSQFSEELPEERTANQEQLFEAQSQLQTTLAGLSRAREQRVIWETMLTGNLNASLARLKSERTALLERFTSNHPQVLKKDEDIAQVGAALERYKTGTLAGGRQRILITSSDPTVSQFEGQLEANSLEVKTLSTEKDRLEGVVSQYRRRLSLTPSREQQLSGMVRESELLNKSITDLEQKQQQSALSADMERQQAGQQFRQLDPASLPAAPSSPPRLKISLGSLPGGLVLGLAIAFLVDFQSRSFHSEKELMQRFGPPFILSVPLLTTPAEKRRHAWKAVWEWLAGGVLTTAMLAAEFYVYKHP